LADDAAGDLIAAANLPLPFQCRIVRERRRLAANRRKSRRESGYQACVPPIRHASPNARPMPPSQRPECGVPAAALDPVGSAATVTTGFFGRAPGNCANWNGLVLAKSTPIDSRQRFSVPGREVARLQSALPRGSEKR